MTKKVVEIPHQLLKEIVKIWAEKELDISRIYEEQTINGRKLDLVGEKIIEDVDEPLKVFFEIETKWSNLPTLTNTSISA